MSDLNNSLIGYLKKKSLFAESPNKFSPIKSRSKQKKSVAQSIRLPNNVNERQIKTANNKSSKNLQKQTSFKNYRQDIQSQVGFQSQPIEKPNKFYNSFEAESNKYLQQPTTTTKRNFNFHNQTKATTVSKEQENINLWTGLVNYANSFESARIESAQCLETMSIKLQAELQNINYKVDMFQTKLLHVLNKELSDAKEKIYLIVNKVFEESERNMRAYVKQQEQILGHELLQMKEILAKQAQKVELMKEQIHRANWKKVAGEILSTELEEKVEILLKKSRSIDIKNWEVGDLGIAKISSLENNLRDMIKLTTK